MIPCSWKETFGVECPSCGAQRSFFSLLQGDFLESILLFPALIPLLAIFLYLPLHLKFKFSNGARIIVSLFAFSAALIALNFIYRVYSGQV
jgi:hypothetical protein